MDLLLDSPLFSPVAASSPLRRRGPSPALISFVLRPSSSRGLPETTDLHFPSHTRDFIPLAFLKGVFARHGHEGDGSLLQYLRNGCHFPQPPIADEKSTIVHAIFTTGDGWPPTSQHSGVEV